jgi:hypothetical protein
MVSAEDVDLIYWSMLIRPLLEPKVCMGSRDIPDSSNDRKPKRSRKPLRANRLLLSSDLGSEYPYQTGHKQANVDDHCESRQVWLSESTRNLAKIMPGIDTKPPSVILLPANWISLSG